jgi:hypothetical protein
MARPAFSTRMQEVGMVVRGSGQVAGYPRAGLQEGRQVSPVQASCWHALSMEGVDPGIRMEGSKRVSIGKLSVEDPNPGSGVFFNLWMQDPGWVKNLAPDPG